MASGDALLGSVRPGYKKEGGYADEEIPKWRLEFENGGFND